MTREVELEIFDRGIHLYDYNIATAIKILESIKMKIKSPLILSYSGLETIDFHTDPYDDYHIGYACIQWIFNRNKTEETECDIRQCLLNCSVEDKEWTKWRNKDLTGIFYRKVTFLPEIQDAVISEISKYITELHQMSEKINEEQRIEEERRKKAKAEWCVVKVYKNIEAYGGETGEDGYYDAEYVSENNEIVRMVSKDVFDFGLYSYPKRLEGTEGALKQDQWTDTEIRVSKWIRNFGVLSGKSTRI